MQAGKEFVVIYASRKEICSDLPDGSWGLYPLDQSNVALHYDDGGGAQPLSEPSERWADDALQPFSRDVSNADIIKY